MDAFIYVQDVGASYRFGLAACRAINPHWPLIKQGKSMRMRDALRSFRAGLPELELETSEEESSWEESDLRLEDRLGRLRSEEQRLLSARERCLAAERSERRRQLFADERQLAQEVYALSQQDRGRIRSEGLLAPDAVGSRGSRKTLASLDMKTNLLQPLEKSQGGATSSDSAASGDEHSPSRDGNGGPYEAACPEQEAAHTEATPEGIEQAVVWAEASPEGSPSEGDLRVALEAALAPGTALAETLRALRELTECRGARCTTDDVRRVALCIGSMAALQLALRSNPELPLVGLEIFQKPCTRSLRLWDEGLQRCLAALLSRGALLGPASGTPTAGPLRRLEEKAFARWVRRCLDSTAVNLPEDLRARIEAFL